MMHESTCASLREIHKQGYTHYETDWDEPCPPYHFEQGECNCMDKLADLAFRTFYASALNEERAFVPWKELHPKVQNDWRKVAFALRKALSEGIKK